MEVSIQVLPPAKIVGPLKPNSAVCAWVKRICVSLVLAWHLPVLADLPTTSLTLAWNPSPSPDVVGYNVFVGGESGIYTNEISVGNTTSVTLSNLIPGGTYYFVVTCYDNTGEESPPSNEAVYTVPADPANPPVALENPALSEGSFSFNVSDGASTSFVVEASEDLINWVPVATNTAPFTFVDPDASQFQQRFYRALMLPDAPPSATSGPPVTLKNPSLSDGSFSFTVPGETGTSIAVEASEDLINWVRVETNTIPFTFVDPDASQFEKRFYRTVTLP